MENAAALSTLPGGVLVDALPYYDKGYEEPGVRQAAMGMIEEEIKRYRPTKNYLEHLPTPNMHQFETEVMRAEMERIASRLPMDMLSMRRYELPPPPAGKLTDITAWQEAVDNSCAQLEHQALRIANLELLDSYGGHLWRSCITSLTKMNDQIQSQLAEVRKQLQELNWQRKNEQIEAGETLRRLDESWVTLVGKNFEIERACCQIESQLAVTSNQNNSGSNGTENVEPVEKTNGHATESEEAKDE